MATLILTFARTSIMRTRMIATGLMTLGVAACSTPYQEMGFMGGVKAQQVTQNTYRIVTRGNGYTGSTTIQDYTLLKAAETTKSAGATHFMIVSSGDATETASISTPGQAQTSFVGNTAYTTFSPGTTTNIIKPGQDTYIKVLTVATGHAPPQGAISADEVIQFVGARVKNA